MGYLAELRDAIDAYDAEEREARQRLRARLLAALGVEIAAPPIQQLAQQLATVAEAVVAAAPVEPSPAGETERGSKEPSALVHDPAGGSAALLQCPDCDRAFSRPQGLGRHKAWAHPAADAAAVEQLTSTKHSYLCARCAEKFDSREALNDHNRAGHPPDSVGLKPLGHAPRQVHDMIPAVKLA
jgi:hypothetical protein